MMSLLRLALLVASAAAAQEPGSTPAQQGIGQARDRSGLPPVLVPASQGAGTPASAPGTPPASQAPGGAQRPGAQPPPVTGQLVTLPNFGEENEDPATPRRPGPAIPPPFERDRPLIEVDGVAITAAELNELVLYLHTWRPGAPDLLLRDAVSALIPRAAVQARYADALAEMRNRIEEARARLAVGQDFLQVMKEVSEDDEAPEGGVYEFGRGEAVQPFDRLSHTGQIGQLQGPFLTQYGYHLMQIAGYRRGLEPKEDRTRVRHILVMFPFQGEPREEIRRLAQAARIRILEPGLRNLLAPEYRDQLEP